MCLRVNKVLVIYLVVSLQILINKEQTILRKNTLLAREDGSKTIVKISNNIEKRVDFLFCPSCFGVPRILTSENCQLLDALSVIIL